MMNPNFLTLVSPVAIAVGAMIALPSLVVGQTAPPMGGGYNNVIPIPVDDPATKNIAGALFKPAGAGPFPAIVYMSGCGGLNNPPEMALEKSVIDHLLAKGVATLVVDPFTPRNEPRPTSTPIASSCKVIRSGQYRPSSPRTRTRRERTIRRLPV